MTADRVTPEESRIAPCPWCGGKAEVSAFRVRCPYCAMMGPSTDRENCIAAWNRVADLAELGASVSGATEAWTWTHPTKEKDYAAPYYWTEAEAREVAAHGHAFDRWKLRRVLILPPGDADGTGAR